MSKRALATAAAVVAVLTATWLLAATAESALANHDSPGDWTVQPAEAPEDRQPGYESASYIHWAQGGDDFRDQGLEEVHHIEMVSEEISFADCTLFDVAEFGIDRGGTNEGTETDHDLAPHVKEHDFAEDRMWMSLYQSHDAGGSPTHLDADDVFIAHQLECYTNPDEPGWYRLEGWANGTAYDGEFDEARLDSHYFWICDCEDESEARERLGPPPSEEPTAPEEPESTPTPDGSDEPSMDDESEDDGTDDAVDAEIQDDEDAGGEPTPTTNEGADGDDAEEAPSEPDADSMDSTQPTPGDGSGLGVIAGLVALLAGAAAIRRG